MSDSSSNQPQPNRPRTSLAKQTARRVLVLMAGFALLVLAASLSQQEARQAPVELGTATVASTVGHLAEDDPRFDCRTMGNQVCGEGAEVYGVDVPAGDYSDGDQAAAPVSACLAALGYHAGPVVRSDAEWCATHELRRTADPAADPVANEVDEYVSSARQDDYAANEAEAGDCEARGLVTAVDHSCVGGGYYGGSSVEEDSSGWSCAVNGNRVCGPGNPEGAPAGCYVDDSLVVPWTEYSDPHADRLWAQLEAPC